MGTFLKIFKTITSIICSVSLAAVLLLTSVAIFAFNPNFYEESYTRHNTAAELNITGLELTRITHNMIAYLRGETNALDGDIVIDGQLESFFNEQEIIHMEDVQVLFIWGMHIRNAALIVLLIGIGVLIALKALRQFVRINQITSIAVLAITLLIALLSSLNFDSAFDIFHDIFFRNDLWLFHSPYDRLVIMLPQAFFADISFSIFLLFTVLMVVNIALCTAARVVIGRRAKM